MVATNMKCPAALVTADTCRRQDVDCMSDSLHQNGYVVMEGPVAGYRNIIFFIVYLGSRMYFDMCFNAGFLAPTSPTSLPIANT